MCSAARVDFQVTVYLLWTGYRMQLRSIESFFRVELSSEFLAVYVWDAFATLVYSTGVFDFEIVILIQTILVG